MRQGKVRARSRAVGAMVCVATSLLAGCVSMAPPYRQPPSPVPERYDAASVSNGGELGGGGLDAAATDWRDYFTDPHLRALIAQALEHNRDLRVAAARVAQAEAAYGIQRADLFPSLGGSLGRTRANLPASASPLGVPLRVDQYSAGVVVSSWELDFFGRLRALKDAARDTYLASAEAHRALALSLVAQVANAYLGLRELDERIALAQQTTDSRRESLRIFSRRVEVGATSRLNLTQVQTLLSQAEALVAQLRQAREQQAHALALLVGQPLELPPATEPLDERHMLADLAPGLPSDLLTRRPDIVAAEYQLKAAYANIGAARAAFFPRVTLTGAYGSVSGELSGLFDAGTRGWLFAPSLSVPLFEGGKLRRNLGLSKARREEAVANYEKTVQGAFRDVADALSAHYWLAEQVRIAQDALDAQSERARLSKLRFDAGSSAFLEVLDAQRDLLSAQQQLVQVRRALLSSRVSLYAALGGGTRVPPDHPSDADGASQP